MGFFGEAQAAGVGPQMAAADTVAGAGLRPPAPAPVASPGPAIAAPEPMQAAPERVQTAMNAPTIVSTPNQDQAVVFDTRFKGTPLQGKWDVVRSSATAGGISPSLAAAVMAHETGDGKNVSKNNPGGIMDPASNWMKKQSFNSIDDGIKATVKTIARNYERAGGSLEGLQKVYAPIGAKNDKDGLNKDWLPGVKKNIAFFGGY